MHCNLVKKLVAIYQMNSTEWMLEYFLPLITVVQAAVKILPVGGIPGTFCNAHAKIFVFLGIVIRWTWILEWDLESRQFDIQIWKSIQTNLKSQRPKWWFVQSEPNDFPKILKRFCWICLISLSKRGIHGPDSRPCSNRTDYGAVNNTNFHFYCYFLIMFARINEPNKLNVKLIISCRGLFFVRFCILESFCVDNLICIKWGHFSNSSKWPQSMTEIVRIGWIPWTFHFIEATKSYLLKPILLGPLFS